MQPEKPKLWRSLVYALRALLKLDRPIAAHFSDQIIVLSESPGICLAELPELDGGRPAQLPHSSGPPRLLAQRLASVSRLNMPSGRSSQPPRRSGATNRPVAGSAAPVKSPRPEAWILARHERRPKTSDVIELSIRSRHAWRRPQLALAA